MKHYRSALQALCYQGSHDKGSGITDLASAITAGGLGYQKQVSSAHCKSNRVEVSHDADLDSTDLADADIYSCHQHAVKPTEWK